MSVLTDRPFELAVSDMTKKFGDKTLWSDLSFRITSQSITVVTGSSGSGKSTLLNCLGMLEKFDEGTVSVDRWSFTANTKHPSRDYYRDVLGFLFQNYGLVESWSVRKNLTIALRTQRSFGAAANRIIDEALDRVGLLGMEKKKIFTLSGGEQQRVAMARLMLKKPAVILADEPTSALDHQNADLVMDVLKDQAKQGALVVIATHSDHIARQCDRTIHIGDTPTDSATVTTTVTN